MVEGAITIVVEVLEGDLDVKVVLLNGVFESVQEVLGPFADVHVVGGVGVHGVDLRHSFTDHRLEFLEVDRARVVGVELPEEDVQFVLGEGGVYLA